MPERYLEPVRQMAADVLDIPADSLTAASGPDNVEAWDSIAHLNLIMAAEERFQVSFSPEEMESVHTLHDLAALLAGRAG